MKVEGKIKCAVSDFDRTLYIDGKISTRNLAAIERWQEAGNWFVLATGRNEGSLRVFLEDYRIRPDALILNNGALILDRDGQELFCQTIDAETVHAVLHYLHGCGDDGSGVSMRNQKVNILSRNGTTTQKGCDGELRMEEIGRLESTLETMQKSVPPSVRTSVPPSVSQSLPLSELPHVLQIHRRNKDENHIRALCRELNVRFPAVSAYANVWNADIVAAGVNKSAAIAWLLEAQGGFEEIRVIGDSLNDIQMIRDYQGATLRNTDPEVQAAASRILEDVAELLMQ